MGFNDHHPNRPDPQKVSHLHGMRRRRVFAIPQQSAGPGMSGKGFGGGYDPEILPVRRHQQLTGPGVGEFVPTELASNLCGVFGPQINAALVPWVGGSASTTLYNHALGFDGKGCEFLLLSRRCVAGIDSNFDLGIQSSIDICTINVRWSPIRESVRERKSE